MRVNFESSDLTTAAFPRFINHKVLNIYFRHFRGERMRRPRKHAGNLEIDFFNSYLSSPSSALSPTLNLNLAVRDDNLQDYAPAGNIRVCRV